MTSRYPRTFPADEASSWRRIRRYAVPRWMIERATERRLAGDWQGACAAANVDVDLDLSDIAVRHGTGIATQVEQDLTHFAPDLLRWHLPRYLRGRTTIRPVHCVLLAGYGNQPTGRHYLRVMTPRMIDGPQRLTLRFGDDIEDDDDDAEKDERDNQCATRRTLRLSRWRSRVQNWTTSRHLWDARRAGELRERSGTERHAEWVTLLHDEGEIKQALAVAGVTMDETSSEQPESPTYYCPSLQHIVANLPIDLTRLEPEIRFLAAAGFGTTYQMELTIRRARGARPVLEWHPDTGVNIRLDKVWGGEDAPLLPEACWRRLPDLELLRFGDIILEQLHPLVSASLFPDQTPKPTHRPDEPEPPVPVRVRCRGEWHEVRSQGGRLQTPHGGAEEQRERAMRAFGGAVAGCFAIQEAWISGTGRLPKALRDQRQELFSRVQHGDSPGVLSLLDSGVDPHVRNGREQTLLHLLHLLDHDLLLPRLLAAGLDIEARDQHQQTPLYVAVNQGSPGLVRALLDAGARTDIADHNGRRLSDIVIWHEREDLPFLADMVKRDYPDPESPRMTRERPYG